MTRAGECAECGCGREHEPGGASTGPGTAGSARRASPRGPRPLPAAPGTAPALRSDHPGKSWEIMGNPGKSREREVQGNPRNPREIQGNGNSFLKPPTLRCCSVPREQRQSIRRSTTLMRSGWWSWAWLAWRKSLSGELTKITVTCDCFLKWPLEFHVLEICELHSQPYLCTRFLKCSSTK